MVGGHRHHGLEASSQPRAGAPRRGVVRSAGDDHRFHPFFTGEAEQQPAGLFGVTVAAIGLVDAVADMARDIQRGVFAYPEIAAPHRLAVG